MADIEIQINKHGELFIRRGSELKEQSCPFSSSTGVDPVNCGDWCPLFGEPSQWSGETTIYLCHNKTLKCPNENFQDLRNEEEN